jgi:hypothetical protein
LRNTQAQVKKTQTHFKPWSSLETPDSEALLSAQSVWHTESGRRQKNRTQSMYRFRQINT